MKGVIHVGECIIKRKRKKEREGGIVGDVEIRKIVR